MTVLIDFTQIPLKKVGVGVYGLSLIYSLTESKTSDQFIVLIQSDEKCFDDINCNNIKFIRINKLFRNFILRFIIEQFYIPFIVYFNGVDVLHSLHYSFPLFLPKKKRVVTIHDLTFFIFPELHRISKRYFFRIFTQLAVKKCDILICVSESTKTDLQKFTKADADKIFVVHLGKNDHLMEFNNDYNHDVKRKYHIDVNKKIILFIGTIEPRKNIITILHSFIEFKKALNDVQLVIVGRKGWYYKNIMEFMNIHGSEDIIFTGFVSEDEKYSLLSSAYIFVYPSIYEGFGIPVLESISYKIPTITSNVSSLIEVGGDAVLFITPDSQIELVNSLNKLYYDMKFREELIERCSVQANKFSWKEMTSKTIKIYKDLC